MPEAQMDAAALTCTCTSCGTEMWSVRKGEWCLSQRMLKMDENGNFVAKCPKCRADVQVPWLRVEAATTPRRRIVVIRRVDGSG